MSSRHGNFACCLLNPWAKSVYSSLRCILQFIVPEVGAISWNLEVAVNEAKAFPDEELDPCMRASDRPSQIACISYICYQWKCKVPGLLQDLKSGRAQSLLFVLFSQYFDASTITGSCSVLVSRPPTYYPFCQV